MEIWNQTMMMTMTMTTTITINTTTTTTKIINFCSIKCDTLLESQDRGDLESNDDDDNNNNNKNHKSL
jgi:hypothetical protein